MILTQFDLAPTGLFGRVFVYPSTKKSHVQVNFVRNVSPADPVLRNRSRINEEMQEQIDAGLMSNGGATIVARRGKVVHFSTHGAMRAEAETDRAMEHDALYIMASSTKPVIAVATLMLVDEGLISLTDPIFKFIPEFANQKVALQAKSEGKKGSGSFFAGLIYRATGIGCG